ncbi:hypothetical protein VTI74DRAFT_4455 [Chaetomium olivicolor]
MADCLLKYHLPLTVKRLLHKATKMYLPWAILTRKSRRRSISRLSVIEPHFSAPFAFAYLYSGTQRRDSRRAIRARSSKTSLVAARTALQR